MRPMDETLRTVSISYALSTVVTPTRGIKHISGVDFKHIPEGKVIYERAQKGGRCMISKWGIPFKLCSNIYNKIITVNEQLQSWDKATGVL